MKAATIDRNRRRLLGYSAAAMMTARALPASALRTAAHVVIVGAGAAGTSMAARLRAMLDGARITLLGRAAVHVYQPGLTLVAAGLWRPEQVTANQADWIPHGVTWIAEDAAELDPDGKVAITDTGRRIGYDFLVVATGLELAYDAIEGFEPAVIGKAGIGCVYGGPEAALATFRMMEALGEQGGDAVMTLPHTPLKCAGAPLKLTFILDDYLRRRNARSRARVRFHSPLTTVFGVPAVNARVLELWRLRDIDVDFGHKLVAVDPGRRIARFATREGSVETDYRYIHVVPPMRAPAVVRSSALALRDGALAEGGWLDVDKDTLRHTRYGNVFGCGDVNGTPRGKTAATVKKSGAVAAANLIDVIAGGEPKTKFDGYTSCPMVTSYGRAMLIEFDYEGRLTPTIPGVEPLTESWFAWFLEERMLKPAYFAMLKGWT